MRVYCKKCPESKGFNGLSSLRKHQWAVHSESFANNFKTGPRHKTVREYKKRDKEAVVPTVKLIGEAELPELIKEMTVSELLHKLRDQKNFLNDVVALIEGLAGGHTK
jgi:hypothetical protein